MSFYRPLKSLVVISTVLSCSLLLPACAALSPTKTGLGEFMSQISARHIKLWYAGNAENWALTEYELEEIHEGLDDVAKTHPTHEKLHGSVPDLIASYMNTSLTEIDAAIKSKNLNNFRAGYDNLTAACNNCHKASSFSFNVIERPSGNPFTNQAFKMQQ